MSHILPLFDHVIIDRKKKKKKKKKNGLEKSLEKGGRIWDILNMRYTVNYILKKRKRYKRENVYYNNKMTISERRLQHLNYLIQI
jgi:hypothetical protein